MKTQVASFFDRFSTVLRDGHPRAVLRLRGIESVPAGAMLTAVESIRKALKTLGIDDLRIEVEGEDVEGETQGY